MLEYNKAAKVPKTFYDYVRKKLSSLCAYRSDESGYYIKPLTTKYLPFLNSEYSKFI